MKADGILGRILRGEGGVHVPVKLEREGDSPCAQWGLIEVEPEVLN